VGADIKWLVARQDWVWYFKRELVGVSKDEREQPLVNGNDSARKTTWYQDFAVPVQTQKFAHVTLKVCCSIT